MKTFYSDTRRVILLASLVLAIFFIILDNHFIYEALIKSNGYLIFREKVRSFKSKSGLKYQTKNNSKDNLSMNLEEDLLFTVKKISANGYMDESTISSLIGEKRLGQVKNFLKIFRNSSELSNTIILGDLIHEFSRSQIDTLFVPFTAPDYCYDLAQTLWCQIQSLSWFVYPISVKRFDNYTYQLSESQYNSINNNLVRVEGSNSTFINVPIANPGGERQNYYLFSYENEIFVYPLNDILSN